MILREFLDICFKREKVYILAPSAGVKVALETKYRLPTLL